ncbi:unnamed protein product [Ilex paraguariensis]|uniref:FAS1 domain-containing protein n=1 Tax=Ilex paraguariensis TaxID=185542 RepID=A0ABC8SWJ8_9AQUA
MAYTPLSLLVLLSLTTLLLLLSPQTQAQSPSAPAPAPSGPINITAILEKPGGFSDFIHLLNVTQAGNQIDNQVNNSNDGMTVFAPTDNAFDNLPAGTLNKLTMEQQVLLVQYHVLPKFYSLTDLLTVSNPVQTQANGPNGKNFGLNFTGQGNQLNVSTGVVETQIYNAVRSNRPLAVYQVDKVLLPLEFYESLAPSSSPPPPPENAPASGPSGTKTTAAKPSSTNDSGRMNVGVDLVAGLLLFCIGYLS